MTEPERRSVTELIAAIRERDEALGKPFAQSVLWDDSDWRNHGSIALDDRRFLLSLLPHDATEPAGPLDVEALTLALDAHMADFAEQPESFDNSTLVAANIASHYARHILRLSPGAPREDERLRDRLIEAMAAHSEQRRGGEYPHLGQDNDIRRFVDWIMDWLDANPESSR